MSPRKSSSNQIICKVTEKMCLFHALSQHKSKQWKSTLWDLKQSKTCSSYSHLIFNRTHLAAAEKSLLCDFPMVIDYIQEINLTKCQNVIHI